MTPTRTYPNPGRGAWTRTGGLLPGKPGATGSSGYYRLATASETPVGAGWATKADNTHHAEAVALGVRALQNLVGLAGASVDGWYGQETDKAVLAAQKAANVEADGIVGRTTMKALLTPVIEKAARGYRVPVEILGGLLVNESALDVAAVGVNGQDHGIAQINLGAHGDVVTLEQVMDPSFACEWSAKELAETYKRWNGKTAGGVDAWDIAIANHNSPLLAKKWALAGAPPYVEGRVFQISEYVAKVHESW
jgi:peptidoglycan hydrolase-like protein with peptidoglycan-binding domain